jgi:ribonuclease P protein component
MSHRARAKPRGRFGFPKTARLLRRAEFLKVQERGQQLPADCVLALVLDNARADKATRVGFTVSSKVGNAVVRNRIRRILRELTRTRREAFPKGLDMVLIARQSAAKAEFRAFVRAFDKLEAQLSRRAAK